jgi:RNA polymerase sigma-70 factor (ECF subfamily)
MSLDQGSNDETSPGFAVPDEGERPGERMEKDEQIQCLMDAMERLSDEHRGILILREMEGMDYEAIAGVL